MGDDEFKQNILKLKTLVLKCNIVLKSGSRTTRQSYLKEYENCLNDCQECLSSEDYEDIFTDNYEFLLCAFNDPVEKCRETSCKLFSFIMKQIPISEKALALIMETLIICLTSSDEAEISEEVRLIEIEILSNLINKNDGNLIKHMSDIIQILEKSIVDPYPEIKRKSCECATDLAFNLRNHFHMVSGVLIKPLLLTLTHQHFKTRMLCVTAIGAVVQYGNNESINDVVSHLAQRLFDHSPLVRLSVVHVIGTWLVELPDRYSFFPRLLPLLLSALSDKTPDVRDKAEELWVKAGDFYLKENEKDYKDRIDFPKVVPSDYPVRQPTLGCRILVQKYLSNILPALMNDIDNWVAGTRIKSAELLYALLLHSEENGTMKLQTFIDGIILSAKDEEYEAAEMAIKTAELLGYFVEPKLWSNLILRVILAKPNGGNLSILAALIRGHGSKPFEDALSNICYVLSDPFVCRTRKIDSQANLLLCVEALLKTMKCQESRYPIFVILSSVAALSTSTSILQKAEELLMLLCGTTSLDLSMQQCSHYLLTFLKELSQNNDLWIYTSPEVSIFMYLVSKGCVNDKVTSFAIPIINYNLKVEKDPKLRSALLSLVTLILKTIPAANNEDLTSNIYALVNDGIFPNMIWSAGRTSASLRAIAVANLWEIINYKHLDSDMLASIGNSLLPILNTLADDDLATNRLLACKILEHILPSLVLSLDEMMIHKTCHEYLRSMDDELDDVRIASTKLFSSYFTSFPLDYNWYPWKGYLQHLYKNIIIHMDDKNEEVQRAVYELLKKASHALPEVLIEQIESVRYIMTSSDLCAELINYIREEQIAKNICDSNVLK